MIAGVPGSGKTMLALGYTIRAKVPSLYVSADSDEWTQLVRTVASISGSTVDKVDEVFRGGAGELFLPDLDEAKHIWFTFDPSPTLEDIHLDIEAFTEMWGQPPALLIIDTLMNIEVDGDGVELTGMRQIVRAMHHFARHYGCAVWLLHHCSEASEWGSGDRCPPRAAIQGKVSQLPEIILTIAQDSTKRHLMMCAVKNRNGPAWPRGDHPVSLYVRPERMGLYEDCMSWTAAGECSS